MSSHTVTLNNEIELVEQIVKYDNQKAINQFVRNYQKFVFHTALRFINNYDDAEDISQEVFIKALNNLNKFNYKSSLKTWLYKITVNHCKTELRKKSIYNFFNFKSTNNQIEDDKIEFEYKSELPNPEEELEFKETQDLFIKAYNKLPEKQRETFILRYFDEMTYEEISELLGTSVGGLKANYFQATKKITDELKKYNLR